MALLSALTTSIQYNLTRDVDNLPLVHDMVLVVSPVEENASGKNSETRQEQQQNLETFFASVYEVSVEDVRVFCRRKTVLKRQVKEKS